MDKAPDAFRTISEVAEVLETPAHVLRFWESRFPQIKPVKRAGGRRYYRPADVALLSGIRQLLHTEGMTIRGVQKVLREHGVRHVASLGGDVSDLDLEADLDLVADEVAAPLPSPVVVPMTRTPLRHVPKPAETAQILAPVSEPVVEPEARPAAPLPEAASTAGAVPRDGEGGFIAFSSPRSARHKPVDDPLQPSLPFETEAPHVWVDAEPEPSGLLMSLNAEPDAAPLVSRDEPAVKDPAEVPELAGLSARLRRLAPQVSTDAALALIEVHSRLGLLHAQMAEAQRLRRPTV